MIKDLLGALGSWEIKLRAGTPAEIVDQLDYFGHIAVVRGPIDVLSAADSILPAARYVGILRERSRDDAPSIAGVGMAAWAGDEDEKGQVFETPVSLNGATFDAAVRAVLPASVQVGFIGAIAGTYTGTHVYVTPRSALNTICAAFGAEWYIGGDSKIYAGTVAQLYGTVPSTVVVRRNAGVDLDLTALGGKFDVDTDVVDYSSRVVLVGQTTDAGTFAIGSASAPDVPYFDMFGNEVQRTRLISESGTTTGSVAARAALQLNRFNRQRKALKVTAEKYETEGNFRVGEYAYVYDPETGVFDGSREIVFRGEVLHPDVVRIAGISYPVGRNHTVAFRRGNGTWIDLTPFVEWETGSNEIIVGDLPKSLGGTSSNPVLDRADGARAAADKTAPAAPSGLTVDSVVSSNDKGGITAQAVVSWTAPTSNTDGSALTDFSNYILAYRQVGVTQWSYAYTFEAAARVGVLPGLNYEFRVAAQDFNENTSAYTATVTALMKADNVAPGAPSDPVVSSYYGQLRIAWDGKTATGTAMPADFNRVDVHVGTTAGFTPSAATLVDSLISANVSYATAPYGAARYVKLVAYDNSGNPSAPSGSVTGATTQVADGDIASLNVGKLVAGTVSADIVNAGRFTTALTGQRTEFNASGFYLFAADNSKLVAIDSTGALITGTYRTALTGRRIEIGAVGAQGRINFLAPDNTRSFVRAHTEASGTEAIQIGVQPNGDTRVDPLWNVLNINTSVNGDYTILRSGTLEFMFDSTAPNAAGSFVVFQGKNRNTDNTTAIQRLVIPNNSTIRLYDWFGQIRFSIADWTSFYGANQATQPRFEMRHSDGYFIHGSNVANAYQELNADGKVFFRMANGCSFSFDPNGSFHINQTGVAGGFIDVVPVGGNGSPTMRMYANSGFGGGMRVQSDTRGTWFEFLASDESGFYGIRANTFQVNSDARSRFAVEKDTGSFSDRVMSAEVKRYKRKRNDDDALKDAVVLGLLAQEAPADIVLGNSTDGMGIDMYQMVSVEWGAIREIITELRALRGVVNGLRKVA